MNLTNLKLIIFDLDGTLIDAYRAVEMSLNYTLKKLGLKMVDGEVIKRTVGWGDRHLVEAFVGEARIDKAIVLYRDHHRDALLKGSSLLPGVKKTLLLLKRQGYLLAVASNRPTEYTHLVMEHLKIAKHFDQILCGDKVRYPKPKPDLLLRILEALHIKASEALYAGDMVIDIEAGHKAGIKTIAVNTGSSSKTELEALNPMAVIDNITGLSSIISNIKQRKLKK